MKKRNVGYGYSVGSKLFFSVGVFCISIFFVPKILASTLDDVQEYFDSGNYSKAIEVAEGLAKEDNIDAIMGLARVYAEGRGVEKDEKKAFDWIEKAAELGHKSAQYKLAKAHAFGEVIEKDTEKAKRTLEKLAEQGHISSIIFLAKSYNLGEWLQYNPSKSFELFSEAAERGDSAGKVMLAILYEEGEGIEKDYRKAFELYKEVVLEDFNLSAEQSLAKLKIGKMYHRGKGTPQNHLEALHWLLYAAEAKDSVFNTLNLSEKKIRINAQSYIARMYLHGDGVIKDEKESAHWYRRAAEAGSPSATYQLATMYLDGIGVAEDNTMAYALFSLAAFNGYDKATTIRDSLVNILSQHELNRAQEFTSSWNIEEIIPKSLDTKT